MVTMSIHPSLKHGLLNNNNSKLSTILRDMGYKVQLRLLLPINHLHLHLQRSEI